MQSKIDLTLANALVTLLLQLVKGDSSLTSFIAKLLFAFFDFLKVSRFV
jgi:hypothetical protein